MSKQSENLDKIKEYLAALKEFTDKIQTLVEDTENLEVVERYDTEEMQEWIDDTLEEINKMDI